MAANTKVVLENTLDGYLAVATMIKGGYISVPTLTDVPSTIKAEGMMIRTTSDNKLYILNSNLQAVEFIYTRDEIDSMIGDINAILDNINGEVV